MIRQADPCLDLDELRLLANGSLTDDRMNHAIRHVDGCSHCAERIEELSQSGVRDQIVPSGQVDSFQNEIECQIAIGQLVANLGDHEATLKREPGQRSLAVPMEEIGPYRLISTLGFGGMGTVYLAEHQRLKRRVAIKLMPRERIRHPGWLERFNREMTSVAAIEHPNVVRAMDAGEESGWHYLVMEFLEGLDLSRVSRRVGVLSVAQVCEIGRQAALGLSHVHDLGMVHRDIKPSNLFLTTAGTVKLLDLGLVLSGDDPLASDDRLTTIGHLMGTVPYMAPEQINDPRKIDGRADIYSLGATMFRLLTGRPPFDGSLNLAQAIHAAANSSPPSIAEIRPELPKSVAALIDSCLARNPGERPSSARELAESLSASADSDSTRSLIQHALTINQSEEEDSLAAPALPLVTQVAGTPKSPWITWLMLAAMPLMFAAGVFITIATDRGTITIRSESKDLQVEILQSEKEVEEMALETNEKSIILRSGKYEIRLKGANADGFVVKNSKITLTRGGKEVVEIIQAANSEQNTESPKAIAAETGRLFQGHAMQYWLELTQRELDPQTLGAAMEAVGTLAENETERLTAARAVLYATETLGGIDASSQGNPSARFMLQLTEHYPKFWGEPGLIAIIEQIEKGNRQSFDACMFLLDNFETGYLGQMETTQGRARKLYAKGKQFGLAYYKQFVTTDVGRQWLVRLDLIIQRQINESLDLAEFDPQAMPYTTGENRLLQIALRQRLILAYVLGADIKNDNQVVTYCRTKTKNFTEENQELFQNSFTRMESGKQQINNSQQFARGSQFSTTKVFDSLLVWGILQVDGVTSENRAAILKILDLGDPDWTFEEQMKLLNQVVEADPTAAANQLVRHMAAAARSPFSSTKHGESFSEFHDQRILNKAVDIIVQHTSMPADAVSAIASFVRADLMRSDPQNAPSNRELDFKLEPLDSAIDHAIYLLLFKAIENPSDPSGVLMAQMYFAQLDIPANDPANDFDRVAAAVLRSSRTCFSDEYWGKVASGEQPNPGVLILGDSNRFQSGRGYQVTVILECVNRIPVQVMLRAISKELTECNTDSAEVCDAIFSDFRMELMRGPLDVAKDTEPLEPLKARSEELAKLIQSPDSKELLSTLDSAIELALGRLDQPTESETPEIRQKRVWVMAGLLRDRLHLLRLQGVEIKTGAAWEPWLRKVVEIQTQRNAKGYSVEESVEEYVLCLDTCLLNALATLDGWDKFPIAELLNSLVFEFSSSTDRYPITGKQLFEQLLASQPTVFRNEFLAKFITADGAESDINTFKPRSDVKWFSAARWLADQSNSDFQQQLFPNGIYRDPRGVSESGLNAALGRYATKKLKEMDTDRDNHVTKGEWQSGDDFEMVDTNSDGEVSFDEYYSFILRKRGLIEK